MMLNAMWTVTTVMASGLGVKGSARTNPAPGHCAGLLGVGGTILFSHLPSCPHNSPWMPRNQTAWSWYLVWQEQMTNVSPRRLQNDKKWLKGNSSPVSCAKDSDNCILLSQPIDASIKEQILSSNIYQVPQSIEYKRDAPWNGLLKVCCHANWFQ